MDNTNTFSDSRGTIKDLIVEKDRAVTLVTFTAGAIRGNHYHKATKQTDVVLSGNLLCRSRIDGVVTENFLKEGDTITHEANEAHAYMSPRSAKLLSTCIGKRVGNRYAKDTFKLKTPLI